MDVVKRGQWPRLPTQVVPCATCDSELRITRRDMKYQESPLMGMSSSDGYHYCVCLVCGNNVVVADPDGFKK